jgi:chemotaxis protein methyltransferase CheR
MDKKDSFLKMISALIQKITGVQLGEKQRTMVETRIRKRMMELSIPDFEVYESHFREHVREETQALVSLLTTHHTYFFREFSHFEHLQGAGLAQLISEVRKRGDKTLRVWSAACSRGQEVYSLSMFLNRELKIQAPDLNYEILGTDVDPESVKIGQNGVYGWHEIKEVPLALLGDHWARGKGEISNYVKAKDSIRSKCRFRVENLLQLSPGSRDERFDVIFCRNVFIYFTREQIQAITLDLLKRLHPHGLFYIGISESLNGLPLPLKSLGPSIYGNADVKVVTQTEETGKVAFTRPARVVCVDDSSSIHALMKQILKKDFGFEIVGHAMNGVEAHEMIERLKPDLVTLDIHMPEMDGIQYLEKHYKLGHPPIMMVTSVNRENQELATRALELGASDFVEKPAFNNLQERGEEIRNKLKLLFTQGGKVSKVLTLQKEMAKSSNHSKGTVLLILGRKPDASFAVLLREMGKQFSRVGVYCDSQSWMEETQRMLSITPAEHLKDLKALESFTAVGGVGVGVLGAISGKTSMKVMSLRATVLLLEDLGDGRGSPELQDYAQDIVPVSSFSFMIGEALGHGLGKKAA